MRVGNIASMGGNISQIPYHGQVCGNSLQLRVLLEFINILEKFVISWVLNKIKRS